MENPNHDSGVRPAGRVFKKRVMANQGGSVRIQLHKLTGGLVGAAIMIFAGVAGAAYRPAEARIAFTASMNFGGVSASRYFLQLGSTYAPGETLQAYATNKQFPISGLAYSYRAGFAPLLMGVPLVPLATSLKADEDSGIPWGWIAAGAALAVGAIAVAVDGSSSDDDSPGATNGPGGVLCTEDECVIPCDSTGPVITCNDN